MLQLKIGTKITQIQNNQNQQNISELTKLIAEEKHIEKLATLYTNRGVLYYQGADHQSALSDMEKALEYNYLNYVVYFNRFTILSAQENFVEGLKNLCCALSCLYLIRGKANNSQTDINKCIKLAENNCEGRLMKALYYERKKKHNLALNQIRWVLDTEPHNLEIIQIKNYIQSLVQSTNTRYEQESGQQQEPNNVSIELKSKEKNRSLKCTLYDDLLMGEDFNCQAEIMQKLEEFNEVLKDIIGGLPCITSDSLEKRVLFLDQKQKELTSSSGYAKKQQYSAPENEVQQQELKVNTSLTGNQSKSIPIVLIESEGPETVKSSQSEVQTPGQLQQIASTDSYFASSVSQSWGLAQSGLDMYVYGQKSSPVNSNYESIGSFAAIKAKDDSKEISVKVENIEIIEMDDQEKYNNMYCLFEYGENKITLINSTGQPESKSLESSDEGKKLVVKLYNKEILAFNDRFLGEGTEQITQPGMYTINLFSNKFQGSIVGKVYLNIKTK